MNDVCLVFVTKKLDKKIIHPNKTCFLTSLANFYAVFSYTKTNLKHFQKSLHNFTDFANTDLEKFYDLANAEGIEPASVLVLARVLPDFASCRLLMSTN